MADVLEVYFSVDERIVAGSLDALLKLIEQEKNKWQVYFPNLQFSDRQGFSVYADYDTIINTAKSNDWVSNHKIQVGARAVFPIFDGDLGKAVCQLIDSGCRYEAAAVILYWQNLRTFTQNNGPASTQRTGEVMRLGSSIYWAIRMSHQKQLSTDEGELFATYKSRIESSATSLDAVVESAQSEKQKFLDRLEYDEDTIKLVLERFSRLEAIAKQKGLLRLKQWGRRFETTHEHFFQQLQYKAPVALWSSEAASHSKRAKLIGGGMIITLAATVLAATALLFFYGSAIASMFYREKCFLLNKGCIEVFSAKGPLAVGTILLSFSLAIWAVRFLSKLYISERHLAINAAERKAFTEAYLGLVQDRSVSREQEAIVLGALFRPSSDGVIRDDGGALDISAASILAKAISNPKTGA